MTLPLAACAPAAGVVAAAAPLFPTVGLDDVSNFCCMECTSDDEEAVDDGPLFVPLDEAVLALPRLDVLALEPADVDVVVGFVGGALLTTLGTLTAFGPPGADLLAIAPATVLELIGFDLTVAEAAELAVADDRTPAPPGGFDLSGDVGFLLLSLELVAGSATAGLLMTDGPVVVVVAGGFVGTFPTGPTAGRGTGLTVRTVDGTIAELLANVDNFGADDVVADGTEVAGGTDGALLVKVDNLGPEDAVVDGAEDVGGLVVNVDSFGVDCVADVVVTAADVATVDGLLKVDSFGVGCVVETVAVVDVVDGVDV